MRAFDIFLNDKKLCMAGVGDDGVLSAIVNSVARAGSEDLFFEVGGLDSRAREHVSWIQQEQLRVGDRVQIVIVEATSVDEPSRRLDAGEQARSKEEYVRGLVQELGWKVQERSENSVS